MFGKTQINFIEWDYHVNDAKNSFLIPTKSNDQRVIENISFKNEKDTIIITINAKLDTLSQIKEKFNAASFRKVGESGVVLDISISPIDLMSVLITITNFELIPELKIPMKQIYDLEKCFFSVESTTTFVESTSTSVDSPSIRRIR